MSKRSTKPPRPIRWSDVTKLDLLTEAEAAELLRMTAEDLEFLRLQDPPAGPPFITFGGFIRYRVDSMREWIRQQFRASRDETSTDKESHG